MDKFLQLMDKLNIAHVYWVDDENASNVELNLPKLASSFASELSTAPEDQVKAALGQFKRNPEIRKKAENIEKIAIKIDENADSKAERIELLLTEILENAGNTASTLLREGLRKFPGPLDSTEKSALVDLFNQVPNKNWSWKPLSFSAWEKEKDTILKSEISSESTLFIIDLHNSSEVSSSNGETVLSDLAMEGLDRRHCHLIVLTSSCKENQEFKTGREFTDKFYKNKQARIPIFVLAKSRFNSITKDNGINADSIFVNALERANLSLEQLKFADIMRNHFIKSIDVAFNTLESITIEELMYAVTHTSKEEGVSEIETLLRLMNIAQRDEFQNTIAENPELQAILIRLRNARLAMKREDLGTYDGIVKLRRAELYDKPEVINKLYSPVAPGDLFSIKTGKKVSNDPTNEKAIGSEEEQLYVVVANACDLMLRPNGTRKLAQCILLPLSDSTSNTDTQFFFSFPHLEFIKLAGSSKKQADFRQYIGVPLTLLDLCWNNPDGECVWARGEASELQANLLDSQLNRLGKINEILQTLNEAQLAAITGSLGISYEKESVDGQTNDKVKFAMRRVGRLSYNHAAQLISRFASVFARPSAEHDFSLPH